MLDGGSRVKLTVRHTFRKSIWTGGNVEKTKPFVIPLGSENMHSPPQV